MNQRIHIFDTTLRDGELRVRLPKIGERRGQGILVPVTSDAVR